MSTDKKRDHLDPQIRNPQSAIRNQFTIHHFPILGSTNDYLKLLTDAPEFTCVTADQQTAGRGRRDRAWHSSPGDGLYLSVLLRPRSSSSKIPLLSLMAAVAVAETLIQRNVPSVDIKWPNDVLVNERKLSGILVEGASSGTALRVILGIGVNLNHGSFPDELGRTATSLLIETGRAVIVDQFRDQLLEQLAFWYELWNGGETRLIVDRWQELSSYARGKNVIVALDDGEVAGRTIGLNEEGALQLITQDGETTTILAGEVKKVQSAED